MKTQLSADQAEYDSNIHLFFVFVYHSVRYKQCLLGANCINTISQTDKKAKEKRKNKINRNHGNLKRKNIYIRLRRYDGYPPADSRGKPKY